MTAPRSLRQLILLAIAAVASGCAPPPELTASQEALVRRCLETAYKEKADPECAQQVSAPMEKAFLRKHPDFYDRLLAERIEFVEERIAKDVRRRDELNACADSREAGNMDSPACEKFMQHEISRAMEDRRLRRCVAARLDGEADAQRQCNGLPDRRIEAELEMERSRRERER